jgi:PncC family amidohydrolase
MPDIWVERLHIALSERQLKLTTAESCTGGLFGVALTDRPGISAVYSSGFITYANEAKRDILGVPQDVLDTHGAVSEATAKAMAEGARAKTDTDLAISITGIAGPGGGSEHKPVGLVYIGAAMAGKDTIVAKRNFDGDRDAVRRQAVDAAAKLGVEMLES